MHSHFHRIKITNYITRYYATATQRAQEMGSIFERETIQVLSKYSFQLAHSGKSHDEGVDFRGIFELKKAATEPSIKILGQCKYYNKPLRSSYLKELEANILKYENQENSSEFWYTGIMVANQQGFSAKCIEQFKLAKFPLILCTIDMNRKQLTTFQTNQSFQNCLRTQYTTSQVELISKKDLVTNSITLIQLYKGENGQTVQQVLAT